MDSARINKVFYRKDDTTPLTPAQLVSLAIKSGMTARLEDYPARISGVHCGCSGPGEFFLMKQKPGEKRYMRCRVCGAMSHL